MTVIGSADDPEGGESSARDGFVKGYLRSLGERPKSPEWDEIERLVGPDICWSIWFSGQRVTRSFSVSEGSGTPKGWHADAKRAEKAARELRALMDKPAVRRFARTHVYRKIEGPPRPLVFRMPNLNKLRPTPGVRVLPATEDASGVRAHFDALPELLDLFAGLADAMKSEASIAPGARPDELKRALLLDLMTVFEEYGLPLATGGNSKLPKVAKSAFAAWGIDTDPRTLLRKMFSEMKASGDLVEGHPTPGPRPKARKQAAAAPRQKRDWFDV